MGREGEREWLTWWAERCRWGACGAVCFSRTGTQPECCEGCLRRWSCPGWSTPPDRLMPHGCSEPCSTAADERCHRHRIWLVSVKHGCDESKKCLFVVFMLQASPCQPSWRLPAVSVWFSRDYRHASQTENGKQQTCPHTPMLFFTSFKP